MMSKEKVEELYSMVMPQDNAQAFVKHMFKVFDKDGNGFLDFQGEIFLKKVLLMYFSCFL